MTGLEEFFHPEAADARRELDAQKELLAPVAVPGDPILTADGMEIVIPDLSDVPVDPTDD